MLARYESISLSISLSHTHTLSLLDPLSMSPHKGIEQIGLNLQKQYERWQPRARYKMLLDPTTDDTRKLCLSLRKTAKVKSNKSL